MKTDIKLRVSMVLFGVFLIIFIPLVNAGFLDDIKSGVESVGKKVTNDIIKKTISDDDEDEDDDDEDENRVVDRPKPVKNTSKVSIRKSDGNFRGIKVGVVELCGDNRSALQALRDAGYEPGRYPDKTLNESRYSLGARNTHKSDERYRHDYRNIMWQKRKIINVDYIRTGEDAYANLFDAEKRRIERQAGIKFTCKKNTRQHECVYRDEKTSTNVRIYKSLTDKSRNSVALNARSNCKSRQFSHQPKSVKQPRPATPGSMTLEGKLNGKILIKRTWKYASKGQFGNKPDDYAVHVYVSGVKLPPGSPRCDIFVYDEFHKRGSYSSLKSIKQKFYAMKGHKVELGNVRTSEGTTACAFSKLRSIGAPKAAKVKVATNSKPVAKNKTIAVVSEFAGVKVNGVKLCGTLEQTAMMLKRQGYFKGQSESQIKSNTKNFISTEKTVAGVKYNFQITAAHNKGLAESISYRATGLTDTLVPFEDAINDFEQYTGLSTKCIDRDAGRMCGYSKNGNSVNFTRYSRKPGLRFTATTNCAKSFY